MIFEENESIKKLGERIGYVSAYFLFTTLLFLILTILNKLPDTWSYFHIMGFTFLIAVVGMGLKRALK